MVVEQVRFCGVPPAQPWGCLGLQSQLGSAPEDMGSWMCLEPPAPQGDLLSASWCTLPASPETLSFVNSWSGL